MLTPPLLARPYYSKQTAQMQQAAPKSTGAGWLVKVQQLLRGVLSTVRVTVSEGPDLTESVKRVEIEKCTVRMRASGPYRLCWHAYCDAAHPDVA